MSAGAELDPSVDIEERLRTVCGHLNVLNAQLVELAAEALATGAWQGWGVRSLAHWLTWQAGISPGHAREVVRLAEARDTHPAVMSTFAAGALSMDQAAMATKAPAYLDEQFAEPATVGDGAAVAHDGARRAPRAAGADEPGAGTGGVVGRLVRRRRPLPPARRAGRRSRPDRRRRPDRGP